MMATWVSPGDDFVVRDLRLDRRHIKNDDSADDVRDVDLSTVHFLSAPVGVKAPSPVTCWSWTCSTSPPGRQPLGLQRLLQQNGGGFLTEHFPHAQKSIWDIHGKVHQPPSGRQVRRPDPPWPDRLPCPTRMLAKWNEREVDFIAMTRPRAPSGQPWPFAKTAHMARLKGDAPPGRRRGVPAPSPRESTAATATSRTRRAAPASSSRLCRRRRPPWATCTSARATARSPSAAPSRWPDGCT